MPVLSSSRVEHVAGRLDRPARHRQHVALHEPVHAGDADRRQQRPDRRRDQAHEQRDEHDDVLLGAGVDRERLQRDGGQQEHDRQPGEQDVEGDLVRASSAGSAPSTSAIIRSRKVSPGRAVIRTTIWSDSTRVPPVTADRSPPDSRMTGADSPVIADSSTDGDALDDLAVARDHLAGRHHDDVVDDRADRRRHLLDRPGRRAPVGGRLRSGVAQRVRLGLAAPFGDRLGEVGEQHGEPQPHGDEPANTLSSASAAPGVADEQDRRQDEPTTRRTSPGCAPSCAGGACGRSHRGPAGRWRVEERTLLGWLPSRSVS